MHAASTPCVRLLLGLQAGRMVQRAQSWSEQGEREAGGTAEPFRMHSLP